MASGARWGLKLQLRISSCLPLYWLNGQRSPMGIETSITDLFMFTSVLAKWPAEPDGD